MHKHLNCPICKGQSFENFLSCEDFTVSHKEFTIVNCKSCGFKFTNPIPAAEDIGNYYKSDEYISHSDTKKGLISKLYHLVRSYTLNRKLAIIKEYVSRGTIIDYGCGTGMFLNTCKLDGWDGLGLEPDSKARETGRRMGLNVSDNLESLVCELGGKQAKAISMWHVLEHVYDLPKLLNFISENLEKDGALFIAVPNYRCHDANYYESHWAAYDVPRHLYHFDKTSIEHFFKGAGFNLVKTLPMRFDSYYVSMLSEKYKRGHNAYLKAIWRGFISNVKARSSKEFSSHIYIFRKA